MLRRPTSSRLFPYTTLFRSQVQERAEGDAGEVAGVLEIDDDLAGPEAFQGFQEVGAEVLGDLLPLERRLGDGQHQDVLVLTDRKSTRLNSSHLGISYAVFCL